MKNLKIKTAALLIMIFSVIGCAQNKKTAVKESTDTVELISVTELQEVDNTIQLIDVRTPKEYADGYIKNAKNIDFYDDNFIEQMSALDKDKPVYIYCKSGGRSGKASSKLKEAGFTKIYDLEGGITKWNSEGKETTKN